MRARSGGTRWDDEGRGDCKVGGGAGECRRGWVVCPEIGGGRAAALI